MQLHYMSEFGWQDTLSTGLGKGKEFLAKKKDYLLNRASDPQTYRRGAISGILSRVNKDNKQVIHNAVMDLDDLAQYGDTMYTRRQLFNKAKERVLRRFNPLNDPTVSEVTEQIQESMDNLNPKLIVKKKLNPEDLGPVTVDDLRMSFPASYMVEFGFNPIGGIKWGDVAKKSKGGLLSLGKKQVDELKEAAADPQTYRRGIISSLLDKINPGKDQRINNAVMDLEDLARYGNEKFSRRDLFNKASQRAIRRFTPLGDPKTTETVEQFKEVIDTLNPKRIPKKPPDSTNMAHQSSSVMFNALLPTLAEAGTGGLLYGSAYVGSKQLMGEGLNPEESKKELAANIAGGTAAGLTGVGGALLLKARALKNNRQLTT